MWRFLVALGFLLALAGLVVMALGVAIFVSSFGNTLIMTGAVSLSSGIILVAVGNVLKELKSIHMRLDALAVSGVALPGMQPSGTNAPDFAYTPALEAEEEEVIEEPAAPAPEEAPPRSFQPGAFPRPRSFDRPSDEPPAPRLPEALQRGRVLGRTPEGESFASRLRAPEPPDAAPEAPETMPAPFDRPIPVQRGFTPPPRRPDAPVPVAPASPVPPAAAQEPSVLKSGIVGGMAYTLYSDGSIQAELPDGTLRFASLQELRDHVARSGQPH